MLTRMISNIRLTRYVVILLLKSKSPVRDSYSGRRFRDKTGRRTRNEFGLCTLAISYVNVYTFREYVM